MPRTMTTIQFADLPYAERKKLVEKGWDIIRFEKGPWRKTNPMGEPGVSANEVSVIVRAKRTTYGDYKKDGKLRSIRIPEGATMRLTRFSHGRGAGVYQGKTVQVLRRNFKELHIEYRSSTGIWGKKK